jgi:hypothetical protein
MIVEFQSVRGVFDLFVLLLFVVLADAVEFGKQNHTFCVIRHVLEIQNDSFVHVDDFLCDSQIFHMPGKSVFLAERLFGKIRFNDFALSINNDKA